MDYQYQQKQELLKQQQQKLGQQQLFLEDYSLQSPIGESLSQRRPNKISAKDELEIDISRFKMGHYYDIQNESQRSFSSANISQIGNKSIDKMNKQRQYGSDLSEEEKQPESGDEKYDQKYNEDLNSLSFTGREGSRIMTNPNNQNKNMKEQVKSTVLTVQKNTIQSDSKQNSYSIENSGAKKRRMLFEQGINSKDRNQICKQGLVEEFEDDQTFTFEDDTYTHKTFQKNGYSSRPNSTKFDKCSNDAIDSSNIMIESGQYRCVQLEEVKKEQISSKTSRRYSDMCLEQKKKINSRQKTYSESQPNSILIKLQNGEEASDSFKSRRSNSYNRNNVFEEENVEEFSLKRKSLFLTNRQLKLSNVSQQDSTISPSKLGDRSPYLLDSNYKSFASGQEDIKSFQNISPELNQSQGGQSPLFIINDKGLTGADLQWRFVGIMKRVKKFTKILTDYIFYKDFKNINMLHIKAIGDISYFVLSEFDVNLQNFKKKIRVIEPSDTVALIWNFILLISIAISIILIPLKTSFSLEFETYSLQKILLEMTPKFILIGDIFINFFFAFYQKGVLIVDIGQIWANYIKFRFIFNTVTTLSYVMSFNSNSLTEWICMLRIFQLPKLIGMIDEHFQLQQRFNTYFELSKLILLIVTMAHFVGCGFHYCAQWEISQGSNHTWLSYYNYQKEDVQYRYINSIYFAFITMITVGYGDIVPISYTEKVYVIVITVISSGLFGYSINTIGTKIYYHFYLSYYEQFLQYNIPDIQQQLHIKYCNEWSQINLSY